MRDDYEILKDLIELKASVESDMKNNRKALRDIDKHMLNKVSIKIKQLQTKIDTILHDILDEIKAANEELGFIGTLEDNQVLINILSKYDLKDDYTELTKRFGETGADRIREAEVGLY